MHLSKGKIILVLLAVSLITVGLTLPTSKPDQPANNAVTTIEIQLPEQSVDSDPATDAITESEPGLQWKTFKVKKGDSMALIFRRAGESASTLHNILSSGKTAKRLKHLQVGQVVEFGYNQQQRLAELRFRPSKTTQLIIARQDGKWLASQNEEDIEVRLEHASGVIKGSLFLSGSRAGLSDNTIMQLAGIFGWDIDFALDIRKGDRFSLIYETRHLNGEKIGDGEIIAAEFINQGKSYQAIRYTNPTNDTDYYSPEGRSMRKAFLRTPVKFSRISSGFTNKRWHPVLKRWRSHKGVDYAAPRGTPVKATSNGKIAFKGKKGGYGKAVFLQHGKTYKTVYGHLNAYAKGLRKGSKVKQGQIIGYVGSTGLATGPHLHYELRVNGVHRNPLKVKLPKALPLAKKYMPEFKSEAQPLLARLALINAAKFADASKPGPDALLPN